MSLADARDALATVEEFLRDFAPKSKSLTGDFLVIAALTEAIRQGNIADIQPMCALYQSLIEVRHLRGGPPVQIMIA